jgi:hypothetical protein
MRCGRSRRRGGWPVVPPVDVDARAHAVGELERWITEPASKRFADRTRPGRAELDDKSLHRCAEASAEETEQKRQWNREESTEEQPVHGRGGRPPRGVDDMLHGNEQHECREGHEDRRESLTLRRLRARPALSQPHEGHQRECEGDPEMNAVEKSRHVLVAGDGENVVRTRLSLAPEMSAMAARLEDHQQRQHRDRQGVSPADEHSIEPRAHTSGRERQDDMDEEPEVQPLQGVAEREQR